MQKINIERTNGNVPKQLAGEDHISGYLAYLSALPAAFATEHIHAISTIESAEKLGIIATAETIDLKILHYQLSEIFRINPAISLYVGLFDKPNAAHTFGEVKQLQNYASGRLRQIAVYCGDINLSSDDITALVGVGKSLEAENAPISILYAPKIPAVTTLENLSGVGKNRVSLVAGQAGSGVGAALYNDALNEDRNSVSMLGVALGIVSLASVHESIGWVRKFPTGIDLPAFGDGTLLRDLDAAIIEALDAKRYLFAVTYSGIGGAFMNDSHTLDEATSDFAMIENVRTMDKAIRGIRTYLLPELGGSVYMDPSSGKLQPYTVENLINVANKALEDMEKKGELSGYEVDIDAEQNVLSSSEIEIIVKPVGVGVARKFRVKIGFATSV